MTNYEARNIERILIVNLDGHLIVCRSKTNYISLLLNRTELDN